jgi:serine/threonine protein kinase
VIKEGTYGDTKDIEGRDIKDRLMWQKEVHEAVQGKVRIPKLIGSFEENGNYYLVMEYLRGKALGDLVKGKKANLGLLREGGKPARKLLKYILQVIDLLDKLHQQGYVHRDVTATNFVLLRSGKMCLIDMELTYCVKDSYPAMPFRLGTTGYMSPQQMAVEMPTVKEDIYALGALMFQVLTGLSANKLTGGADAVFLQRRINYFVEDANMGNIIFRCLSDDALQRPTLSEVSAVVAAYRKDMKNAKKRPESFKRLFTNKEIYETIQEGIESLSSALFADSERGWFADSGESDKNGNKKLEKTWQASINAGVAGVFWFLSNAKKAGYDITSNDRFIGIGIHLIEAKYIASQRESNGLLYGPDGIAVALAEAIKSGVLPATQTYFDWIAHLLRRKANGPSIIHGYGGQGIANLFCAGMVSVDAIKTRLVAYVNYMKKIQQSDGSWDWRRDKSKVEVARGLGAGTAGVAYFLLSYVSVYKDDEVLASALAGLQWLMQRGEGKNELEWYLSEKKDKPNYSLGDGGAGIALAFLKAFEVTGNVVYADFARRTLAAPAQDMLWNNLTLLNGASGLGLAYLEAFRVLGEEVWKKRAEVVAQNILHLRRKTSDGIVFWLGNHELKPTAGLMIGNSGILYFLMKYFEVAKA